MLDRYEYIACLGMPRSGSTLQYNLVREIIAQQYQIHDIGFLESEKNLENIANLPKPIIFKSHRFCFNYLESIREKSAIFYTHRDPIEVYISGKVKFKWSLDTFIEEMKYSHKLDLAIDQAPYVFRSSFQNLTHKTLYELVQISEFLDIDTPIDRLEQIASKWSLESTKTRISSLSGRLRLKMKINRFLKCTPDNARAIARKLKITDFIRKWIISENIGDPKSLLHPDHISDGERKATVRANLTPELSTQIYEQLKDVYRRYGYAIP